MDALASPMRACPTPRRKRRTTAVASSRRETETSHAANSRRPIGPRPRLAQRCPGLAGEAGAGDRAVRPGLDAGHRHPGGRRSVAEALQATLRGREQGRRQRQYRHRRRRQGGRRTATPSAFPSAARWRSTRSCSASCPTTPPRTSPIVTLLATQPNVCAVNSFARHQHGAGARRLSQGQSGQAQLRLDRQRLAVASRRRGDPAGERLAGGAHPLRGVAAGDDGAHPRRRPLRLPAGAGGGVAADQPRHQGAGDHDRRSDPNSCPAFETLKEFGVDVECDAWNGVIAPAGTPAGDRRPARQGDRRHRPHAGRPGKADRPGDGADPVDAERVPRPHRGRHRPLDAHHQGGEHQGELRLPSPGGLADGRDPGTRASVASAVSRR